MRGSLKSDPYFADLLIQVNEDLARFSDLTEKARELHGEGFRGVRNGYLFLELNYSRRFDLLYTLGTQDDLLPDTFRELLRYSALTWDPQNYSYWDLLKVLSLAILLNADPASRDLAALLGRLKEAGIKDYLADRLCQALDPAWPAPCDSFFIKNTFEPLKPVFDRPDVRAVDEMKAFLQKRWLMIHRGCSWYGGHNHDQTPYYGYWAYECAAVVKMLKLDDTSLRGQRWYPYDLVRMDGNGRIEA